MICCNCKNILKQRKDFPTIWDCNNKKCSVGSVVITQKPVEKKKRAKFIKLTRFGFNT